MNNSDYFVRQTTAICDKTKICGAISFTERGLALAGTISDELSLATTSYAVAERALDKSSMRQILPSSLSPRWSLIGSRKELKQFKRECQADVILKPRNGVGSSEVVLLRGNDDIDQLLDDTLPALAEEQVLGQLYSVEALSFAGTHRIIAITKKRDMGHLAANGFVAAQQTLQSASVLETPDYKAIEPIVHECLNRIGLKDGPSHTELILSKDGPKIVETHNRTGGDKIHEMTILVTGIDMVWSALNWYVNQADLTQRFQKNLHKAASIRFFDTKPGRVTEMKGLSGQRYRPGVVEIVCRAALGTTVPSILSARDRIGYVLTVANSPVMAESIAADAMNEITITTVGAE